MASRSLLRIMISTRLYLDSRNCKPGHPAPLKFVITKNKVRALISLNIKIPTSEWDAGRQKASGAYATLNTLLTQKKSYVDTLIFQKETSGELDGLSASGIKKLIEHHLFGEETNSDEPKEDSFRACFEEFKNSRPSKGTRGVYAQTWRALEKFSFHKKFDISRLRFEDITPKWLRDFDSFLSKTSPSRNARNIHFRNIRAVFNDALDDEIIICYPFRKFKIRPEPTKKRSLTLEQLRTVFEYPTEEYAELYRDMFKLIFFLCGINSVDLYNLQKVTADGRVEYRRAKTGRLYSLKIEPEAKEIIDKWRGKSRLLCISDRWNAHENFRHQMNKALQSIGTPILKHGKKDRDKALFPDLTTYWARHTWATIAASLDIPKETIAAALGHGGNTVTDIYIDFDRRKVDDANRKVIDWVLYGKI